MLKKYFLKAANIFLHLFLLFPVKKNQILFVSFSGHSCACSPKYICDWLMKEYPGRFSYVWASDRNRSELFHEKVRFVKYKSLPFFYFLLTSKVYIENSGVIHYAPYRKSQFLLDTWHGGGAYKKAGAMENERKEDVGYREFTRRMYAPVTCFLSSSRDFSKNVIRDSFLYEGKILECGLPRNDCLFAPRPDLYAKVRMHFGLPPDEKLVLYAPTFRGDFLKGKLDLCEELDPARCCFALAKKFGGHWTVLFRAHHTMHMEGVTLLNATDYPDMQELLSACDVLITDYSSSIWDYCLTGKPGFLFAPDLEKYIANRGFEKPIALWPYPFAKSNEELEHVIAAYDDTAAKKKIQAHLDTLESCETGHACETVGRMIYGICFEGNVYE